MKADIAHRSTGLRALLLVWLLVLSSALQAQGPVCAYTVRDGKMFIELPKSIRPSALDSFVRQFELEELQLSRAIVAGMLDSLTFKGWQVHVNNASQLVIYKGLMPIGQLSSEEKIILAEKDRNGRFDPVNNGVMIGANRFRNKHHFAITDSVVTFFLRHQPQASSVMLAGSFNNWSPVNSAMVKVDSGWIARLSLPPGKYWYKFIVDGKWLVDEDNLLRESDGQGNINSVYFKPNHVFLLEGYRNAKKVYVAGSFNGWRERDLLMLPTEIGWGLPVYLAEGTHTYRFIVDGHWMSDEDNPLRQPNEFGEYNSVVRLGAPHLFRLKGFGDAKKVYLSGSFNGWREDELLMQKTADGWELPHVLGPGNYEYRFRVDGRWTNGAEAAKGGQQNRFLVIQPNYTFRLKGFPDAKKVAVAGDFNGWNPDQLPMTREGDEWVFTVHLFQGKTRYKFIVDGKWILDPGNKLWEGNEFGTGNSVLWFGSQQR